jgi:hypothetical protein
VLLIATEHNSLYALDAQTYAVLWQVSLGNSVPSTDIGCTDVVPEIGISGTPVVIRSAADSATVYLVAASEPARYSFHAQIHALDLRTGKDIVPAVEIAPTAKLSGGGAVTFDPQDQWVRAGLASGPDGIYVGIGSHCDFRDNRNSGWLLRYSPALKLLHAFNTIDAAANLELASIWMSGYAPAIDAAGNVFVVTGNGNYNLTASAKDYGESVLKLSGALTQVIGTSTPANYQSLNGVDGDFGSSGVMLLPTVSGQLSPPLAVAMGKNPEIFLLDQNILGGLQGTDKGPLQALPVAGYNLNGGPAYYRNGKTSLIYYQIGHDVLRSYAVVDGVKPTLSQLAVGTSQPGYGGSIPIVSSNGGIAGTGVVWLIRRGVTEQLEAYDAVKLGAPIFAANAGKWSNTSGNAITTPIEANGRVYVPSYKAVSVFGLTK